MHTVAEMAGACLTASLAPQIGLPWFAVRVREKFRKTAEQMLDGRGIEFFSPMTTELRQWSDRRKIVELPLFSGYMFCRFDPQLQSHIVARTMGVIDIVRTGAMLAEVNPVELDAVRIAIGACPQVEELAHLVTGQRVRVTTGPMCDVEGVLIETKARYKLVLAVTMMNRSVAVQIDRSHVVAI